VPVSVCLIDIDDFKKVNDGYGHPTGDRVLAQIGSRLRQGGEAFRLGGDEFALLLPARDPDEALAITTAVVNRIAATECEHGEPVSVSAGIATYPEHGMARAELVRVADSALYWAKEHGKNRVRVYRADVLELAALRRLAEGPDRAARLRAAASLAEAVDARDVYTRSHSHAVGEMAGRIANRMGLDPEEVQLVRLAGRLHDLGKLAIPEEILRKPAPLDETERLVLERHPQIGFRMLDSLGVDPVAAWVLHHHEHWDGNGYPDRLFGELIPLGSRIVLVADAYDAMTNERTYRAELSHDEAVDELVRCAGTQFDPAVVAAFRAEFGASRAGAIAASAV
jgi:diguanylate cyclase (GGDEF)-like protein/putative nucleotidyltransferase with HDIG domain